MSIFYSKSEAETNAIARDFAKTLKTGDIVALHGTLGVGKTAFTRGVIEALCGKTEVPSPTFTLLQMYDTPDFVLYHFDMYRLKTATEAYEVGIEDAFSEGVSFIEWPEKLGALLPKKRIDVYFEMTEDNRQIMIQENE